MNYIKLKYTRFLRVFKDVLLINFLSYNLHFLIKLKHFELFPIFLNLKFCKNCSINGSFLQWDYWFFLFYQAITELKVIQFALQGLFDWYHYLFTLIQCLYKQFIPLKGKCFFFNLKVFFIHFEVLFYLIILVFIFQVQVFLTIVILILFFLSAIFLLQVFIFLFFLIQVFLKLIFIAITFVTKFSIM